MYLIYLLLLASIFPGFSIYNISIGEQAGFPLLIYYFIQIIIFIILVYKFIKNKSLLIKLDQKRYLYYFCVYVFIISITSPIIFQGTEVVIPRLGISLESIGPLILNFSIIGQLLYLLLNISTVTYICNYKKLLKKSMYSISLSLDKYVSIIATIPIFFLIWELMSRLFDIYYPYEILFSNKFGSHAYNQSFALGIYRFNSTFSEPSFFGLFSSGFTIFFLCRASKILSFNFFMYITYFFTTISTTSTTGMTALLFGHIAVIIFSIFNHKEIINSKKTRKIILISIPCIILFIFAIAFHELTELIIKYQFIEKTSNESGISRLGADQFSLLVIIRTYFIGAGLGANRPSSFLMYLASNTGLVGLFLFVSYLFLLIKKNKNLNKVNKYSLATNAYALSLLTVFLGMCIGVPDLNQPYLWFWIFLCELNLSENNFNIHEKFQLLQGQKC